MTRASTVNERTRGIVEMTVAMTISGTIGWFVVVSGRPVLDVVFWRCLFGAGTLLAICACLGLLRGHLTRRVLCLSMLGGIAIVLNWVLLFASYSRASIAVATTVYNTQPFLLVGLGAFVLGEKVTPAKLGWLAVAFGGLVLIVQVGLTSASAGPEYLLGILLALGAAVLWAIAALLTKQLAGTPPHLIALIHVCVGCLLLAPFADWAHPLGPTSAAALAAIGIVHTGLVYILMYQAIHRLPTYVQGSLSFVYPVVAIVVDVGAFGRQLEPMQITGAVVILVAVVGMNGWSARRPQVAGAVARLRPGDAG